MLFLDTMPTTSEPVQKHTVHTLVFRSLKRTYDMFVSERGFMPKTDPSVLVEITPSADDPYCWVSFFF